MASQSEKAQLFQSLHIKGDPVVLYNIWDPGSAAAVVKAGAKALATGSAPVAMARGLKDGQDVPMELAIANAKAIADSTDLPLSLDFEGGYAVEAQGLISNITAALQAGVVGFNFEDQVVGREGLYEIDVQKDRVAAVHQAIEQSGVPAYLNARTDIFLKSKPETHNEAMVQDAINRAQAYADAGASGFFAPGLLDEGLIGKLCDAVSLPVNILAIPGCPPKQKLAERGVARISYGPVPYRKIMAVLGDDAAKAFA